MPNPSDHYGMLKDLIPFFYDWYWGDEIPPPEKFFLLIDDSAHNLLIDDSGNKLMIQGT